MRITTFLQRIFPIALILLLATFAQAQDGTVRGKIYDEDGLEASFATVQVMELEGVGVTADLEGTFSVSLSPGTYTLNVSYVGFGDTKVTDVVVNSGEITVIDNVLLKNESEELVEVVVTAKAARNTTNSVMTLQKKSVNLLDGLSVQAISQSGDSDAGAAVKRITGVTVEDGKNVYVRGLGDRYTKTVLNGMEVPGLDPDRNTVQVDVFPANILNNILVYKTFTPDLSGDFTGGTVDIELKNFPEERYESYSLSLGYNANTTFNKNFQTYTSSPADAFALGGFSRQAPIGDAGAPGSNSPDQFDAVNSFDKEMSINRKIGLPNTSLSYSWGNQFEGKNGRTRGLVFAANYRNSSNYYSEAVFNDYFKPANTDEYELAAKEISTGEYSTNEALWSILANGSIKSKRTRHSLSLFHTQNGIKQASQSMSENLVEAEGTILDKNVLYYNQKSITSLVYDNRISRRDNRLEFTTKVSPSFSTNKEPDVRFTALSVDMDEEGNVRNYALQLGDGARLSRIFRSLMEGSLNVKADVTWKFNQWNGLNAKLKGGLATATKMRDFGVVQYDFRDKGNQIDLTGNPDQFFETENIYNAETNRGVFVTGQSSPANQYTAISNVAAAYLMNELPLSAKLKSIYGVRVEKTDVFYDGRRQAIVNPETDIFDYANVLNTLDVLPSASLIYNPIKDMNIRAAYSRTLARPSFKEKSAAEIFDPITDRTFIGNIDLKQTYIQNMDLRWEYFFQPGEMLSVSSFYKKFKDPIEIVSFDETAPDSFIPNNAEGGATVYGVEFEARKNFGFIAPSLSNLTISSNVSYIKSALKIGEKEYTARLREARQGEEISDTREMQGQSPYIINTNLNYTAPNAGWNFNASYNVQGKRLSVVGIARIPDVYERPFHSLNLKMSKHIGINNNWKLSLSAQNILNQNKQRVFESYRSSDQIYASYNPGMSFSVGIGYAINGNKEAMTKLTKN